ncbi:MAG: N-acetylglucosamine-6-phosphate deacetylase [Candidatus Methylomirabilales bacterium]
MRPAPLLLLTDAHIFTPRGEIPRGYVVLAGDRIAAVGRGAPRRKSGRVRSLEGRLLLPGFVDLQVNGGGGFDFADPDPAHRRAAATFHLRHGTTTLLPTLITDTLPRLRSALGAIAADLTAAGRDLPRTPGIHLEGPFLNPRRAGAHPREAIHPARLEAFEGLWAAAGGAVRLLTLAPEMPGALEVIAAATARGCLVAMGHTDATAEEATAGITAGIRHATHLFNAMAPLHHREPGAAGVALADRRVSVGLIPDGVHVHPTALALALRLKGPAAAALTTDAISLAGCAEAQDAGRVFTLGAQRVTLREGRAVTAEGTLAGSLLTMDGALRRVVEYGAASLRDAARMASETPARILGLADRGRIVPGALADLVILEEDLTLHQVLLGGRPVPRR